MSVNLTNPEDPSNLTGLGLDPTIQQTLALYPKPNGPAVDETRGYFFFPSRSAQDVYNLTTRVDHRFTDNHNLAVRYAYNYFSDPNPFHSEFLPGLDVVSSTTKTHGISANYSALLEQTGLTSLKQARIEWTLHLPVVEPRSLIQSAAWTDLDEGATLFCPASTLSAAALWAIAMAKAGEQVLTASLTTSLG